MLILFKVNVIILKILSYCFFIDVSSSNPQVPFLCPLEGHVYLKMQCEVGSKVEEKGFLVSEQIKCGNESIIKSFFLF